MMANNEPYLSSYFHAKGKRLGLPIAGTFELTARCNFHCPMCYVHLTSEQVAERGKELTTKQWIDLATKAKDEGMIFLLLTGGEPFVRSDFFEIYEACQQMGLVVSINSNGSMLKKDVLERLLKNPPARMNISLYGSNSNTYQRMCGQPAFDDVVHAIKALKQAGVEVRLNLTMTPYNRDDLQQIFALACDLQVQIRAANYMYPAVRVDQQVDADQSRFTPEESVECAILWDKMRFSETEFYQRACKLNDLVAVQEKQCPAQWEEGLGCRAGTSSFWVCWDGKMRPCGLMVQPEADVLEVGFSQAWQTIKEQTKTLRMPKQCLQCNKKEICGVCAAVCQTETGSTDQVPNYMCRQSEAMVLRMREIVSGGKCDETKETTGS